MELASYTFSGFGRNKTAQKPLLVMPIGDIQWAGEKGDTALEMLKRHIAWGVKQGAWFLGMGDYIDFASPSNRQRLSSAALYDTATDVIDDAAMALTEQLYREALKPSKGRWLGLLEGHHFLQLKHGQTTDMKLAEMLDTKFLGTCAMIRLQFKREKSTSGTVVIWCHHGSGGGNRAGAPLNKLDLLPTYFDADIFLMGHVTKKVPAPLDHLQIIWGKREGEAHAIHRTKIIASTGGFSKGYQVGRRDGIVPRGNYVEQRMLTPAALGGIVVRIVPRWGRQSQSHPDADVWIPDLSVEV